jgi:hypothetical protein
MSLQPASSIDLSSQPDANSYLRQQQYLGHQRNPSTNSIGDDSIPLRTLEDPNSQRFRGMSPSSRSTRSDSESSVSKPYMQGMIISDILVTCYSNGLYV